jgi:hypothetical protein
MYGEYCVNYSYGLYKNSVMHQLIYLSSANKKFTDDELKELLRKAREKNMTLQLTGMLLYIDGNFIQVLEGDEKNVTELMKIISVDQRHSGILKLIGKTVTERIFPDWTMGFKSLSIDEASTLSGYKNFGSDTFKSGMFENMVHPALTILKAFYKNNTRT